MIRALAAAAAFLSGVVVWRRAKRRHPLDWPVETDPVLCELDEERWSEGVIRFPSRPRAVREDGISWPLEAS